VTSGPDDSGPLAGLRVLDLATFLAAPYAATILSEFGADVIKIEKPGSGDPLRQFGEPTPGCEDTLCWLSEARNKRSVTLDLRTPAGAAIFRRLVREADIVCESFRPGTLEQWGLGFEQLLQENPRLIMLRVSGYGQTGPLRGRAGFARIAHAFGGLTHLTGMPSGPPLTPGTTSLADYVTGLYGAIGILIALHAREKVQGQYIDLALYESVFRLLDDIAVAYAEHGIVRGRAGLGTSNACPHGQYQCGDGKWVALACSSDKIFARMASLIGQPGLAAADAFGRVEQRLARREAVDEVIRQWLATRTMEQVVAECERAGVPCAPVQTIADIFASEQFAARGNLLTVEDPELGEKTVPNVVPRLSKTPGRLAHLGPRLGSSNREVLGELLGRTEGELIELARDGGI
jgi:succinyl-CoA:(S)-malate CoA-transferase subunit A/succinyl-CoA:(S)-malate CoA-transferase subunit B